VTRLRAALSRVTLVTLALLVVSAVLVAPAAPAAAASAPAAPAAAAQREPLARLDLNSMHPRVVTASGPDRLTVTGEVVNVGDRTISDLAVRVQRDRPLDGSDAARAALSGIPDAPFVTEFTPLPGKLEPGESVPFRIEVALGTGPPLQAFRITEPGVYPILVNLNGTPDFGGPARLAAVPLLLPVLQPPGSGTATADVEPAGSERAAAPLTIVWPLVAEPVRRLPAPGEPLLIASPTRGTDPLAAQLAPGGRLDGLVRALEQVVTPGSPLAGALCVAVGPALLDTVSEMTGGYRVRTPAGVRPGTGAADAQQWLDRLRDVVAGRCVLPLPYGDPDLVALSRAGLTDLEAQAGSTGAQLVADILGVTPLLGVNWPADGVLDERTLSDLAALGTRAVLLAPHGVGTPPEDTDTAPLAAGTLGAGTPAPTALITDPVLSVALDESGRSLAAQDAIGALAFRALESDPRPVLLAPPRRWQIGGAEATALLRAAQQLLARDTFRPRTLPEMAAAPATGPAITLTYPRWAAAREIPPAVTAEVADARDVLRDLQVATHRDPTVNLEPAALLDPIRRALLRAVSTAWRGDSDQAAADRRLDPDKQVSRIDNVDDRLEALRASVRIVAPPSPYTLASSDSPLLITVRNELPVSMEVVLSVEETPGLRTGSIGVQLVPARSSRQFTIPAEVVRTGQFSVDARLTTPGGTPLGQPSTLQLHRSGLDAVTVALTAGAGGILILLVTRRFVRRHRQQTGEAGAA
jgi:hypothetical protein